MPNTLLDQAIVNIYNTGFFDYALPFMVTFAVFYGILKKTNILGKENKKLNPVFALIVSLTILPFVSKVNYITFASKLVFIIIKFVMVMIVLGLLGFKFEEHKKHSFMIAFLLILAVVVTEFFNIASFKDLLNSNENVIYAMLFVIVFAIVIWVITGKSSVGEEPKTPKEPKGASKVPDAPEYDIEKVARIPGSDIEKEGFKF